MTLKRIITDPAQSPPPERIFKPGDIFTISRETSLDIQCMLCRVAGSFYLMDLLTGTRLGPPFSSTASRLTMERLHKLVQPFPTPAYKIRVVESADFVLTYANEK